MPPKMALKLKASSKMMPNMCGMFLMFAKMTMREMMT